MNIWSSKTFKVLFKDLTFKNIHLFSFEEEMFIIEFRNPPLGLSKTLGNLSPFTGLSYIPRQKEKKNVYYISSCKAIMKTELIPRVLWNYGMKDDIYIVISPATARNHELHGIVGI